MFPDCCSQCPIPVVNPCPPKPPQENLKQSRWFWFSRLWGHCSFSLGLGAHKILFVPSKTEFSVSHSFVENLLSNLTGIQGRIPWGFPMPLSDSPGWEAWHEVYNLDNSGRTSLVLLFCSLWILWYGFDFYHDWASPTIPLKILNCLGCRVFLVDSSILLPMVVQQLVAIFVLLQEERSMCPTSPSWTGRHDSLRFQFYSK